MKAFFGCLVLILTFVISVSADPAPYGPEFAACCKEKGVTDSCQKYCSFDFHPTEVIGAFTNGTCKPETDTAPYYQCLQNSKNMIPCCKMYGVISSEKPQHCLDLCDGSTPIKYDPKYTLCAPDQDLIMSCGIDSHMDSSKVVHKSLASPSLLFSTRGGPICNLTIDAGTCNDYQDDWWYYDIFSKECYKFTWSGCGGNPNRFYSKVDCLLKCGNPLDLTPTEEPEYTDSDTGSVYRIFGTLSCAKDEEPVGNGGVGSVILMEYDPVSANDVIGTSTLIGNYFEIYYSEKWYEGDFPTGDYEFYLLFKNVCGHWRIQKSGIVLPYLNVTYLILDNWFNSFAYVPEPFPGLAAEMDAPTFRDCWFNPTAGPCDMGDLVIKWKHATKKYGMGGGGPGK